MKTIGICSTIVVIGFIVLCLVTTKSNSNSSKELPNVEQPALVKETEREPLESQTVKLKSNRPEFLYRISKVEFSGHTYIVVEDHGTAILHDPDCKCQTQK